MQNYTELDGSCGCDDNYFSVINNSPLLSGNQEMTFNPEMNNTMNSINSMNPMNSMNNNLNSAKNEIISSNNNMISNFPSLQI